MATTVAIIVVQNQNRHFLEGALEERQDGDGLFWVSHPGRIIFRTIGLAKQHFENLCGGGLRFTRLNVDRETGELSFAKQG